MSLCYGKSYFSIDRQIDLIVPSRRAGKLYETLSLFYLIIKESCSLG